jgi:hypothetical protein
MDRSILAWIMPRTIASIHKEYTVTSITTASFLSTYDTSLFYDYDADLFKEANYSVIISKTTSASDIKVGDDVVIAREGELNFYAKVVAISLNPLTYHIMVNSYVLADLVFIKSNWYTLNGYSLTVKSPINVLDGIDDYGDRVFSVNIYANQFIAINYSSTEYVIRMDEKLLDDTWYGIIVNIGNEWKQYTAYVWEKHISDKNAKLQNKFYKTLSLIPENINVDHYSINKSPAYITNIRLYNVTIEEEKQSNELLTYFVKDAEQAIILDNADQLMRIPYVTKQR